MPDKHVWVQIDGAVRGPFPPSGLRALASSGRVGPDTLISLDKTRWVPARNIKNLFKADPAPAAATVHAPRPKPVKVFSPEPSNRNSPGDSGADRDGVRFPVIRMKTGFFQAQVVAIYQTHLLKGSRFLQPLRLTEEMCHPSGEPELRRQLHWSRSVELGEGSEVRETANLSDPAKVKSFPPGCAKRPCHFEVRESGGEQVRFSLPPTEIQGVHSALFEVLGDRYLTRPEKRGGWVAIAMCLLGPLFLLMAVAYSEGGWSILGTIAGGMSLALIGGGLYMVFVRRGPWSKATEVPTLVKREEPKERTPAEQPSNPLHDPLLGWCLKFLGLAYWIAIASPLTDGLRKYMVQALKNTGQQGAAEIFLWAPAPLMIYAGYRLCQRRYDPKQSDDTRKPILFLRPFEDDASTSLQPPGALSIITGVRGPSSMNGGSSASEGGRISAEDIVRISHPARLIRMVLDIGAGSSEETIARYFESYGPVVAIGRPGESLSTPGAARVYLADDEWQAVVLEELKRSQVVVMQPGSTEGVRWELDRIRELVEPYRVLLCLVSFWKNPEGYEELTRLLGRTFRVEMPRVVPFLDRPAFVYFDAGWVPRLQELSYKCPALWPMTTEAADLNYSLHPFLQGIHGGDREPPRRPRWTSGVGTATSGLAAFWLGLAFVLVPIWTVHFAAQSLFRSKVATPPQPVTVAATPPQPVTVAATPLAERIPQVVARSSKITLAGVSVPYRFEIPETLVKLEPDNAVIEHFRKSPDRLLGVQVIAFAGAEDVSNLAETRLKVNTRKGILGSTLDSARTVRQGDVDWVEARVSAKLENGLIAREIARGTSDARGTVYAIVTVVGIRELNPVYLSDAEEILTSFRFFERSGPDIKPTEPGPASGSTSMSVPTSPPSGPTPPPEQQTPDLVARSAKITLQGRAVPYQFEIPEGLVKHAPKNEAIEHERKSPDFRLNVQVIAHDQQEDLSHLAEQRLKANSGEGVLESKLKAARTVKHAGADWVEALVLVKLKDGVTVQELSRGTSGPRGTVLVVVIIISFSDSDPIYQRIASEMLQSFRFAE